MHKPTTAAEEERFIAFLEEGLVTLDANTPTYINSGGCGFFAKLLSEQLTAHRIDHKILAVFPVLKCAEDKEYYNKFKKFLAGDQSIGKETCPQHVVIQIGELCFDSNGVDGRDTLAAPDRVFPITMEQLDIMLDGKAWNKLFDRDTIPDIKARLEKMFASWDEFHHGSFGVLPTSIEASANTIRVMQEQNPFSLANILG